MSESIALAKSEIAEKSWKDSISDALSEKLGALIESRVKTRSEYYAKHPEKVPVKTRESSDAIISNAADEASMISRLMNIVPGPQSLVLIVPEIIKVLDIQIAMIYDLAIAHGKQKQIGKELVVSILLAGSGLGATVLAAQVGTKLMVKRASLLVMQNIAKQLSVKITQKAIGSSISKFIPMVGSLAMAGWTRHSTKELGAKAVAYLSQDIEIVDAEIVESEEGIVPSLDEARLRALFALAAIDGKVSAEEDAYLREQLELAELTSGAKTVLQTALTERKRLPVEFSVLAVSPEESIRCLVDMVALAGKDGVFHPAEKLYIKKSGAALGVPDDDVEALISMIELTKPNVN